MVLNSTKAAVRLIVVYICHSTVCPAGKKNERKKERKGNNQTIQKLNNREDNCQLYSFTRSRVDMGCCPCSSTDSCPPSGGLP